MSGWDNLEGYSTRTGARVVENAKLRHPGHLGLDHVCCLPVPTVVDRLERWAIAPAALADRRRLLGRCRS
eukprot:4397855-Prymnesium_polylepis.1